MADLFQDHSRVCISGQRWISVQGPLGELDILLWPSIPPLFDSHSVSCMCSMVSGPKDGKYVTSIFYTQINFIPSLPLPLVSSPSVHRRQSPDIYPVSVVISISKYKQETSYKCLITELSIPCLTNINRCHFKQVSLSHISPASKSVHIHIFIAKPGGT